MGNSIFKSFGRKEIDFVLILWTKHLWVHFPKLGFCKILHYIAATLKLPNKTPSRFDKVKNCQQKKSHDQMDLKVGFCTQF